jgi:cellulose synthase/poly-beta-1,6-N-acetylglucosamine synthase-like glycosyltransferase
MVFLALGTAILWLLWLPLAAALAYLLLLTAAAATPRRSPAEPSGRRRLCVVVPAHNEALVIEPVLRRLMAQAYPRDDFEVVVVADNCSDTTAQVARRGGARVLERWDPDNRGKGHALAYAFAVLRGEPFDAYIVLDADTLVADDLLSVMNRYLAAGHRVIQAHYDVLEPFATRRTALMYIALRVFNYVRPLGRRQLGLSTGLQGNGMCFAREVVERYAWNAFSLAEDIEYTTTLVLNGERVVFAPEAHIWAQMPAARPQATTQRMRWEAGRLQMARRDGARLVTRGLQRLDWRIVDWGIDLLIPPLAMVAYAVVMGAVASAALAMVIPAGITTVLLSAWLTLAVGFVLFVLAAMVVGRVPRQGYMTLLSVPAYLGWKLWVYILIATRRGPTTWVRTDRARIVDR